MQKPILSLSLAVITCALIACNKEEIPELKPTSRPVKTMLVDVDEQLNRTRQFPARIEARQSAEMSFQVAGKVNEILIKEGQKIKSGQVLARLDKTDFEIIYQDKLVSLDTAKKNFTRAKRLMPDGYISEKDYDELRSLFLNAKAAKKTAEQNLKYTELTAPFDGEVAKKSIENFEQVQAKQVIFLITDRSSLKLNVDLPERLIQRLQKNNSTDNNSRVTAVFDANPDKYYPTQFESASTSADANTQTFEVTFVMPAPKEINLLPGMSATIQIDFTDLLSTDNLSYRIPVTAVTSDNSLGGIVWVVNEDTMTVHPRPIKVAEMSQGLIHVTEGLNPKDRIVTAGVPFLTDGMKVTLLSETEQAK